jgi:opacity protein-like surface antigen
MIRSAVIATSLTIFSLSSYASDIPRTDAEWTGCSVGVAGGYIQHDSSSPLAYGLYDGGSHTNEGALGGARLGCDVQFDQFVLGAQGSYDWMNINARNAFYPVGPGLPEYLETNTNWFATATMRAGVLVTPSVLLYAKAGAAWLNSDYSDYDTGTGGPTFVGSTTASRKGWTVGGGIEYAIDRNWFASAEYTYADFGTKDLTLDGLVDTANNVSGSWSNRYEDKVQAVTLGIRYKF